jgi:hypothetical protein
MEPLPLSAVQACQTGLAHFAKSTSKTQTLGHVLRIINKTIRFFSLLYEKEVASNCSRQIKGSIEILGVVQGVHLAHELLCPDAQGQYFIQRASLEKCVGQGLLFGYNFLSNLKLAEKLELAPLPEFTRIVICGSTLLRLQDTCKVVYGPLRLWNVLNSSREESCPAKPDASKLNDPTELCRCPGLSLCRVIS